MRALTARRPRLAVGMAFGIAGTGLAALWYLPLTLQGVHPVLHSLLFVVLPGAAAAAVGAALGKPLAVPAPGHRAMGAALRGALIATVALVIFAPLFAALFTLTEPGGGSWNVLGLTSLLLVGSALATWVPAAATGAGIGLLLFRLTHGGKS